MRNRKILIRRQLLKIFNAAAPWLVRESLAFDELSLIITPPPSQSEFDDVIRAMDADRVIVRLPGCGEFKTKLSDEGRAELLQ